MTIRDSDDSAFASNLTFYVRFRYSYNNANANVDALVFGGTFSEPESDGVVHTLLKTQTDLSHIPCNIFDNVPFTE